MFNNSPENYQCRICLGMKSGANNTDIVYQDDLATVFVSPMFLDSNPGCLIIVPNGHFENIYDLPSNYSYRISDLSKYFSIALKEVQKCDGVTVLQNNEPASGQYIFHYHVHLYPRFTVDNLILNGLSTRNSTLEERKPYADDLIKYLQSNPINF